MGDGGSAGGGASASNVVDDKNDGAVPQEPTQFSSNVVDDAAVEPQTDKIPTKPVPDAGVWGAGENTDTEDGRRSSQFFQQEANHGSAPPSDYPSVQQNTEKPANEQFKPEFLTKIKSTVEGGLDHLKREIAKDLSLNNVLDLFIESQNEKLIYLNSQFGQSGEESNIEIELQKAFKKFKQDFTSTQKTTSQFIQTTQSSQYQQEAEELKTDITSNQLTSEQKDKLRALATQNDQKDLAEKLKSKPKGLFGIKLSKSTKLTTPQQEQLIKLVQQDLFTKQESQLVPKITATIIANDNQPIVSELTKKQVFQKVADKLQPLKTTQETIKQEVLEKFITQLDKKTPDSAAKPSIAQLKTELQKANNAPAQQQQILVQFLAKKDIPQQAKDGVLQILESTETKDSLQQQARQDFINEVKIATLATQLQDTEPTLEKQQILVQFLANRANSSITAEVETVLQKIKKEEETKSPPKQERTDFVRKIEEQSDAIKTFTQHRNPEPESGEISAEEIATLEKSKVLKVLDIKAEDLKAEDLKAVSDSEVDKILKDFSLYVNDDDFIKQELLKISTQDKQKLQDYAEKTVQFLTEISQEPSSVETDLQVDLSISVESIETQKKTFDAVLKLLGVKYKSDRDKYSSIIFSTADLQLSMTDQIEKMYIHLEKPLDKLRKYDDLLEKIMEEINNELTQKIALSPESSQKETEQLQKNELTIQKLKNRKKSFKSLFARIQKAITQS